MSEFGKIHKDFWCHRKVQMCTNGAIGLWAKANAWCRDNRTAGVIPLDVVMTLGSRAEADELVAANLWLKGARPTGPVAIFKDYDQWNNDVEPDSEAGDLVRKTVPASHPSAVRGQLVKQSAALLREGISPEVVEAALKLWLSKGLGPSLLPSLASQAMVEVQRAATVRNTVDQCIRDNVVTPLKPFGFIFTPPDTPHDMDIIERRVFMTHAKQDWLHEIREKVA